MAKVEPGMESMIDMYIFETSGLLDNLDEILLRTEQANCFTEEDINEIFRIMHTVKGSSAMMGFENLQELAHKGEDMFFIIRENPSAISDIGLVYDLVFQMSDLFKAEVEQIQTNDDYEPSDFSELIHKLEHGAKVLKGEETEKSEPASEKPSEPVQPLPETAASTETAPAETADKNSMTVRVFFQDGCKMENLRAFLLLNKMREEANILGFFPEDVESNSESANIIVEKGFLVTFSSENNNAILKIIEESVNVESYEVITDTLPKAEKAEPTAETPAQPAAPVAEEKAEKAEPAEEHHEEKTEEHKQPETAKTDEQKAADAKKAVNSASGGKQSLISVNLVKLDQLHDIVGEIITTESMVISNPELDGLQLESFQKAARELRKLTNELQDTVMSIRMVPLTGAFQKMNRIVRDMKIKLNKDVELVIEGDQTEVDKSIVDQLNDPLMHLVRNCMDHGIEENAKLRTDAGKPAKGTIKLTAVNASGEVIITVSDDGGGIDTSKILAKAERNGLLTKPASEYTEREIQNLILLPGFSTNEVVTEFSGRGVGMDVVKKNIEKVGGSILVESKHGEGTTFIIKIPLTLAIIDGMEISVGNVIFTVPISVIKESFKITGDQIIHDTEQGEMIMIRGNCYPIMRLSERYGLETEVTDFEDGILLLIETENKSVCLFSDRLIGEQQVVVKPFPTYLSQYNVKAEGLSGCTIMGDGSISLIIDVSNLISAYK